MIVTAHSPGVAVPTAFLYAAEGLNRVVLPVLLSHSQELERACPQCESCFCVLL
ncbi:hypothetical protein HMPREF0742_01987 [Rothia aeria F0184]|uniref:Uncharacterized protein n=1 Tax=Rothia aeria F0184 TaxID=888019 RepID=U7V2D5_9MICC|nr:hypothetical protein HMPREF0742_01987 [Rothia aeria F0184]